MYRLFTDGSEYPHIRCGGWGFVLIGPDCEIRRKGYSQQHGVNVMELTAVIEGLKRIPPGVDVIIYTDSHYVVSNAFKYQKNALPILTEFRRLIKDYIVKFERPTKEGLHKQAHHLAREAIGDAVRFSGTSQYVQVGINTGGTDYICPSATSLG